MSRYDLSPVFGSAAGVFISLSAWCTVYLVLSHYNPRRRSEWHCRVTTVIHAVVICLLAVYSAAVQGPWPFSDPGGPNTPLQRIIVMMCLGYFIFDLAWCLSFQTEGLGMLAHHVLSILGLTVTLFLGRYGTEMMASIVGTEITNPLLQLRWFLRETGRGETSLAFGVNVAFVFSFGFFRIGIGSYLLYTYFSNPQPDNLGKFGGLVVYMIGWMFWVQICIYSYKKLFRPRRNAKKTSSCHGNASVDKNSCCNGLSDGVQSNEKIDHVNNIVPEKNGFVKKLAKTE